MVEQAPAGWYPDGHGNERFWDGTVWTEQLRPPARPAADVAIAEGSKSEGAFSKMGAAVKRAAADKKAAKEEATRKHAEDAASAGTLVTSGVFGLSTVEIYESGYVRVATWPDSAAMSTPAPMRKDTPYERLRSIKFARPAQDADRGASSALEGAVGPAVASLIKGGRGLMKASAPGLAVAGVAHLAGAEGRRAFLTIATDKQIHALTNQTGKKFIGATNRGHNDVGMALEAAGNSVLKVGGDPLSASNSEPFADGGTRLAARQEVAALNPSATSPTLTERLRELAALHQDGILSDEEFSAAKAKLLSSL